MEEPLNRNVAAGRQREAGKTLSAVCGEAQDSTGCPTLPAPLIWNKKNTGKGSGATDFSWYRGSDRAGGVGGVLEHESSLMRCRRCIYFHKLPLN